jgi:hypothetical protein
LQPPTYKGADLEERFLVLIPGADVATEYYRSPMTSVQDQANLRLWVFIPMFEDKLCSSKCSSKEECKPLKDSIEDGIRRAAGEGYGGPTDQFFLAGHNLGASCATNYTVAYEDSVSANILYGSFVPDQDV